MNDWVKESERGSERVREWVSKQKWHVWKNPIKACDSSGGQTAACVRVYFGQDVFGDLQEGVVSAGAAPSFGAAALGDEQRVEQKLGLLKVFRNVDVLMHPKHLWLLYEWQVLGGKKDDNLIPSSVDKGWVGNSGAVFLYYAHSEVSNINGSIHNEFLKWGKM